VRWGWETETCWRRGGSRETDRQAGRHDMVGLGWQKGAYAAFVFDGEISLVSSPGRCLDVMFVKIVGKSLKKR